MSPRSETRTNLALALLFLGTFTLGSAELLVVGVLNVIAGDLHVSLSTAGILVTAYALGLSIGGPVLTGLTIRVGRRSLLITALTVWLAGNVLAAATQSFALFVAARVVTGALQGVFVGAAFAIGTSIVPRERIGRALSAVIGGFAVSTALGVPIGTLIGQEIGWRGAFLSVVGLGVVVLILTLIFVPSVPTQGAGGLGAQVKYAFSPPVLAMLGLAVVYFLGQYATLTYITSFLGKETGISGGLISVFLLAYGLATAVGAVGGGRFADRNATRAIVTCNFVLIIALGGLFLVEGSPVLVALAMIVWGVVGFGAVPSLQYRVLSLAGPGKDLAATLPASAINAGIAIGALAGGWALSANGSSAPVVVGVIVSIVCLPLAWATGRLKTPAGTSETGTSEPGTSEPRTMTDLAGSVGDTGKEATSVAS
jgi:DHA1 family inner membrane transport protein